MTDPVPDSNSIDTPDALEPGSVNDARSAAGLAADAPEAGGKAASGLEAVAADLQAAAPAPPTPGTRPPGARKGVRYRVRVRRSPVDRWLIAITIVVVATFVGAAASVVALLVTATDAPRSAAERQLLVDQTAVKEKPQDVENWGRLALSYGRAGRWGDAEWAIAQGRKIKKAAIIDLVEADVLRMANDPAAIAAYDRAIKSGQAEYEAAEKQLFETKGVSAKMPNPLVFQAMVGRALALDAAGRTKDGVDQALKAIELDSTDAAVRVILGDMLVKLDRLDDAEAQYVIALKYVPDLAGAKAGLKRIGRDR